MLSQEILLGQYYTDKYPVQCCLSYPILMLLQQITQIKALWNVGLEAPNNNIQEKILFNIVLIFLEKHCTGQNLVQCCLRGSKQHSIRENPGQYCLNTLGTILHRSKPYAMLPQRIQRTLHKKNPVQCCLIKNPMQWCPRGSRQHCIIKNPVQCCLNTLGTILHGTKSYAILLRGSRQHCIIKKSSSMLS